MVTPEMRFYRYFSDIIGSNTELPELLEESSPDVTSSFLFHLSADRAPFFPDNNKVHHWRHPIDNTTSMSFAKTTEQYLLDFPKLARFSICKLNKIITAYPMVNTTLPTIRHLLLDQVLPRLFAHLYKYTVLHSSSIEVNGKSICFLGDTGWGKSTLATGFEVAGHTIMTDDCIQLFFKNNTIHARASYKTIRLLPDSIQALYVENKEDTESTAHYSAKKRFLMPELTTELPVRAFFILANPNQCTENNQAEISPLPKSEAVIELLRNSFCLNLNDNSFIQQQFSRITTIAESAVPAYHLCYPRKFEKLQETIRSILQFLDLPLT